METVIENIKNIDIGQLIAISIILWFFYSRLNSKIDKLDQKLVFETGKLDSKIVTEIGKLDSKIVTEIGKLDSKIDKLDQKFSAEIDKLDKKFSAEIGKLDSKIDKLDFRMKDLEHDMIEVKTILRMKECCMIQDDRQIKKVE